MTEDQEKINSALEKDFFSLVEGQNPENITWTPELEQAFLEKIKEIEKREELIKTLKKELEEEKGKELKNNTSIPNPVAESSTTPPIIREKRERKNKKSLRSKLLMGVAMAISGTALLPKTLQKDERKDVNPNEDKIGILKKEQNQEIDKKTKVIDSIPGDSIKKEKPKEPETGNDPDKKIFNEEVYNKLPGETAQEIYRNYCDNDPTPGYGYQILDKDSARIFIFDKNNALIKIIVAGYGQGKGDKVHTSLNMTTPSGIFMISDYLVPTDIEEFNGLGYSLFGYNILGEKTDGIGLHETWEEELLLRTEKLESPTPDDNVFSHGCINISRENFLKYVKPNFKGKCRELFYVLPDKESKKQGNKYNLNFLLKKVMPHILSTAEKRAEAKNYEEIIKSNKEIIDSLSKKIPSMTREQGALVEEWKKEKKNKKKEKKVANKNIEIKKIKQEILDAKKALEEAEKEQKSLVKLKKKTDDLLAMK